MFAGMISILYSWNIILLVYFVSARTLDSENTEMDKVTGKLTELTLIKKKCITQKDRTRKRHSLGLL